ncbi:MAG: crossover junction endodeoxyribonuclease RuvC [Candidatus Aminicenantes bacterium]|nr:crossover junction endodeoxyribonuclease RuvC [Candidatus Aminicenantes bacterium]
MLILGMDPGSLSFGIGLVKKDRNQFAYLHSEVIQLKEKDFVSRMQTLWARLNLVTARFPIDEAAMEEGFLGKNIRSMSLLSMVRGVAMASLLQRGVPLRMYSPREVKLALTGYGNAEKTQLAKMASLVLGVGDRKLGLDESDALAVAYCHGVNRR